MEFLRHSWNKIKSHFYGASYEGIGIDPDFIFMQNLPTDAWERSFVEMETTPEGLEAVRIIVDAAQKRTEQERQVFAKKMMSGHTTFVVGKNAKETVERQLTMVKFIAEVNSMSQENLDAIRAALSKLASH